MADSCILQNHGQCTIERDFSPQARIGIQLKDLRNALNTAHEIGFEAPVTAMFEQRYAQGVEHGLSDLDHSGLFVELASRNAISWDKVGEAGNCSESIPQHVAAHMDQMRSTQCLGPHRIAVFQGLHQCAVFPLIVQSPRGRGAAFL